MKIPFTTIGTSFLLVLMYIMLASASITEVQAKSDNGIRSAQANSNCVYGPDGNQCIDYNLHAGYYTMVFWTTIPPGATARIDLKFNAHYQNQMAVSLVHRASMQQVWVGGSFPYGQISGISPKNLGTAIEEYLVLGWYKYTWPNGSTQWFQVPGRVRAQGGPKFEIGFEGGTTRNFIDVIATITWDTGTGSSNNTGIGTGSSNNTGTGTGSSNNTGTGTGSSNNPGTVPGKPGRALSARDYVGVWVNRDPKHPFMQFIEITAESPNVLKVRAWVFCKPTPGEGRGFDCTMLPHRSPDEVSSSSFEEVRWEHKELIGVWAPRPGGRDHTDVLRYRYWTNVLTLRKDVPGYGDILHVVSEYTAYNGREKMFLVFKRG